MERPKVGIGIIILNQRGEILVGKRKGSHAPYYSIPGGHLEMGERFEVAARKEVFEETGLRIHEPRVVSVTNNLKTFAEEKVHSVSINLLVKKFEGTPVVKEADRCEGWLWCHPEKLPRPHFDASEYAIECYLKSKFYIER